MRARAALISAQIQCEVREIALSSKPQEMLTISPKGTVPVLLLPTGQVLEQSLDIMHWALPDQKISDEIHSLILKNDGEFKIYLDHYKYAKNLDEQIKQRTYALNFLYELEEKLSANLFLSGPKISFADFAILPFVRQFSRVDLDWFTSIDLPKIKSWLNTWHTSDLFNAVMKKYNVWDKNQSTTTMLF